MDYLPISNFLEKFKKSIFQREDLVKIIIKIILKETKISLDLNQVKIKNNTIYLQINPIQKNEILIHKNKIITALKKEKPEIFLSQIR